MSRFQGPTACWISIKTLNANYMRKEISQFDECYLVKGRASKNDATNINTENETFSKLGDFHYPKVISNIQ